MSAKQPWYGTKRWQIRRAQQLRDHPLCVLCLEQHRVTAATVADHITPHKGDYNLFWHGELQSLCAMHHNTSKKHIEDRGYHNAVDVNGAPIDPMHPANKIKSR